VRTDRLELGAPARLSVAGARSASRRSTAAAWSTSPSQAARSRRSRAAPGPDLRQLSSAPLEAFDSPV